MAPCAGQNRRNKGAHIQSRRRPCERDQPARTPRFDVRNVRPATAGQPWRLAARGSTVVRRRHSRHRAGARLAAQDPDCRRLGEAAGLAGATVRRGTATRYSTDRGAGMRVALINPNWHFEGSIYFGCREPHLPIELAASRQLLEAAGHKVLLIDGHLFDLRLADIATELRAFRPEMTVFTTAPTYLFWRCAPPELRVCQELAQAARGHSPLLVAVGPHGSTTPRAALRKLGVDIVVMGECEETLLRIANGEYRDLAGVCYRENGHIRVNGGPQAAT